MEIVGTVIYIAIAVVALYGVLRGAMKGLYKSLVDLGITIVVAFLSVWIAKTLSKTLVNEESLIELIDWISLKVPSLAEALGSFKEIIVDFSSDTNVIGMALSLPAIILSPFIFMILYLVLGFILKIPKMILTRCIFGKSFGETYHGGSRIIGGAVGGVVRALSFAIFLIPIIGYINLTSDTLLAIGAPSEVEQVEALEEEYDEEDDAEGASVADTINRINSLCYELRGAYIAPIADNFAVKAIHTCGGKWIFNTLSSAKIKDQRITLSGEINVLVSVYREAEPLLEVPIEQFGEKQVLAVNNITTTLDGAVILPSVISGVLSHASQAWLDGEAVFGYEKMDVGEYYEPTLDKILSLLAVTTQDTVKQDIHTIGNLVTICIEENFFKDVLGTGNPVSVVENGEFLGRVFVEIYKNDKSRPLVQDMVNAMKNYIYRVYNDVNGTAIPYPNQLAMDQITEQMMYDEGVLISSIAKDFIAFSESFNPNETDNTKLLIETDVRSLGKGLDKLGSSIIIGDSYHFLLSAILRSQGAAQLQFLTPEFIELLTTTQTSMEVVLVSRQEIAVILSASTLDDRADAIEHLLKNIDPETASVIMETLTPEVLSKFGMGKDKSQAMSGMLNSIIGEIATNNNELSQDELESEIEAVDKLVNTVQGAIDGQGDADDVFSNSGGEDSIIDMTTTELVETVVNSSIVSSAITSATVDSEGNTVEDPYKLADKLSENDKASAKDAIESYYNNNAVVDGDNAELEKTLGSLATILGVEITLSK